MNGVEDCEIESPEYEPMPMVQSEVAVTVTKNPVKIILKKSGPEPLSGKKAYEIIKKSENVCGSENNASVDSAKRKSTQNRELKRLQEKLKFSKDLLSDPQQSIYESDQPRNRRQSKYFECEGNKKISKSGSRKSLSKSSKNLKRSKSVAENQTQAIEKKPKRSSSESRSRSSSAGPSTAKSRNPSTCSEKLRRKRSQSRRLTTGSENLERETRSRSRYKSMPKEDDLVVNNSVNWTPPPKVR